MHDVQNVEAGNTIQVLNSTSLTNKLMSTWLEFLSISKTYVSNQLTYRFRDSKFRAPKQCPMFLSISYNVPFLWEKTRTFLKALTEESCTFCGGPDQRLMQRKRAMGKTEQDMSRLAHLGSQSQDIICFILPLAQPVINDIAK